MTDSWSVAPSECTSVISLNLSSPPSRRHRKVNVSPDTVLFTNVNLRLDVISGQEAIMKSAVCAAALKCFGLRLTKVNLAVQGTLEYGCVFQMLTFL